MVCVEVLSILCFSLSSVDTTILHTVAEFAFMSPLRRWNEWKEVFGQGVSCLVILLSCRSVVTKKYCMHFALSRLYVYIVHRPTHTVLSVYVHLRFTLAPTCQYCAPYRLFFSEHSSMCISVSGQSKAFYRKQNHKRRLEVTSCPFEIIFEKVSENSSLLFSLVSSYFHSRRVLS